MSNDEGFNVRADDSSDLSDWIRRARGGSRRSLGRALESCRGYLTVIATDRLPRSLRSKVSRSDLVQRTLAQATKDFWQFQGNGGKAFKAWLHSILHFKVQAISRHYRAHTRSISREVPLDGGGSGRRGRVALVTKEPAPLDEMLRRERADDLKRALLGLEPDEQRIVALRQQKTGDSSWAEIGMEFGISAGAARARWYRALQKLRAKIQEHHDD